MSEDKKKEKKGTEWGERDRRLRVQVKLNKEEE